MKIKNIILLSFIFVGLIYSCSEEMEAPQLNADFNADKQEIIAGEAVNFNDASMGNPSKWDWTFEGGTPETSVLHSPSVTYETPGTYQVKLMIGRAEDSTVIIKDEYITVGYGEVTANFSANKTSVMQGESISFTDLSEGTPTSWNWEFIPADGGEIITSDAQNPTITFPEPGIYTVKLKSSNPVDEDEKTEPDYITVIDPSYLEADFNAELKGTYSGGTIQFKDASLGTATAWNWAFEGGNPAISTEQNPIVAYNTPGRYKVTLVASNDENISTKEVEDYVLVVNGTGLAAFYPFDGSKNDAGPNNVVPDKIGEISFGIDRNSVENGSITFDGASVLVVPDNPVFNFEKNDFTVGCWINSDQTSKMMVWMESGGVNGPGDQQAWLRMGDNETSRKLRFAVEDASGGKILNMQNGVADNKWHHVVCVREGFTSRVYIDGALVAESDGSQIKDTSSEQPFKIGAQEDRGGGKYINFFKGQLDDLIIYNRALAQAEITDLYNL